MFGVFSLISLLVIPGICSQEWKVQYSSMSKCVLKGSTTHLSGTFKHSDNLTVTETVWTVNPVKDQEHINLLNLPNYRDRVQYFLSKDRTFGLRLRNVRREDEGMYCIRILTNVDRQRYLVFPGIELNVTELRVEIPEEVVEKDSPVLFCKSTCNLSDKTDFIWYKNGESLSESSDGNRLILQSVSRDDTGNYSCAARDQEHLPSPAVTLSVRYPPQSVSVSSVQVTVVITASVVMTVILMLVIWLLIRRKRVTPSEERNHRASRHPKTVESPEDAYMTLDPKSRCSEYDTLDNMKRSCDTDDPEDQDSTYYNMDK